MHYWRRLAILNITLALNITLTEQFLKFSTYPPPTIRHRRVLYILVVMGSCNNSILADLRHFCKKTNRYQPKYWISDLIPIQNHHRFIINSQRSKFVAKMGLKQSELAKYSLPYYRKLTINDINAHEINEQWN